MLVRNSTVTPEQKSQNVKALETVVEVAAGEDGHPVLPLTEWYSLGPVSPAGGCWYFVATCPHCRFVSPLFADYSEGDLGNPFKGGGVHSTCHFCGAPISCPSERFHSFRWPLKPEQPEPESEYRNRKPRKYTKDLEYRPVRGPLHHYTSLDAVESIVRNRVLWATHIDHFQDKTEGKVGRKLMSEVAKEALGSASGTDAQFLDYFLHWNDGPAFGDVAVYVLCFTDAHDSHDHWSRFTKDGNGACLSLDSTMLVARMQAQGWTFQNPRYGLPSQLAWAEAILSRMRTLASVKLGSTDDSRIARFNEVLNITMPDFLQVAATIKESAFSLERETRFISPMIRTGDSRIHHYPKSELRIPYVHFDLGNAPLAVHQIMVGPGADQRSMEARVERFVRETGVVGPCALGSTDTLYREIGDGRST
jgi:hypothetical protein